MSATHFSGPVSSANGFSGSLTGAVTATTASASTSLTVGGGTAITKIVKGTCTVDLPDIADGDVGEATVTITGAAAGDIVILVPPTAGATAGLAICGAQVSAADTVKLRAVNGSGGSINESSGTWYYLLIRS